MSHANPPDTDSAEHIALDWRCGMCEYIWKSATFPERCPSCDSDEIEPKPPALRAVLQEAIQAWPQLDLDPSQASDSELYINGADLLEWFSEWRQRAIYALKADAINAAGPCER